MMRNTNRHERPDPTDTPYRDIWGTPRTPGTVNPIVLTWVTECLQRALDQQETRGWPLTPALADVLHALQRFATGNAAFSEIWAAQGGAHNELRDSHQRAYGTPNKDAGEAWIANVAAEAACAAIHAAEYVLHAIGARDHGAARQAVINAILAARAVGTYVAYAACGTTYDGGTFLRVTDDEYEWQDARLTELLIADEATTETGHGDG
ncbi:MAG: hypothetical protein FJX76_16610 [Armatimonadetes bacterium]|nr:hypothetical protein [Armatimonadota bacterium]